MALFNYATKEITLKIVYYGPGLCGKTTNLQYLHQSMTPDKKGKLLSLSTDADRTLFFDFMPIHLGKIRGFNIRFQLYTVPGQVRYNATRKLVLKGADAIVFVADSQTAMKDANVASLQNMKENLIANNLNPDEIPTVLQYNKRDLPSILAVDELNRDLNPRGEEAIESSATEGWGVPETFHLITKRLLKFISEKHNVKLDVPDELKTAAPLATASSTKDKVHIALEDRSSSMLSGTSSETELEESLLKASMPEPAVAPSQWEESQLETTPFEESTLEAAMPAHRSATSDDGIDWDRAFSQPVLAQPGEQTELERMLAEEEGGISPDIDVSLEEEGSGNADSSTVAEMLLQEMRQIRKQQGLLLEAIKKMEDYLRNFRKP